MIHHSDRGIQYACTDYVGLLQEHGIQISMSRVGNSYR
jgi:putative transposase